MDAVTPPPAPDRLTALIDEVQNTSRTRIHDHSVEVEAAYRRALAALRAEAASMQQERNTLRRQLNEQIEDKHRILREYEAQTASVQERLARAEADIAEAAGECLVPIPEPGTDLSRVLIANTMLRRYHEHDSAIADAARDWFDTYVQGGSGSYPWLPLPLTTALVADYDSRRAARATAPEGNHAT